jgi:peptide/nickel transport system permease protein
MAVAQPAVTAKRPSRLERWWKTISIVFESKVATIGLAIVAFWVLVGFLSLFWTPAPPNALLFDQFLPPNTIFVASILITFVAMVLLLSSNAGPRTKLVGLAALGIIEIVVVSWQIAGSQPNLLGTDNLGRDTLSRLMTGTQVILLKTRIPPTTLGIVFRALATIPALVSVLIFAVDLAKIIGNRLRLFGLILLWLALGIVLGVVIAEVPVWMPLTILFGVFYFGFFVFGWIRAKHYQITEDMKAWTWSLLATILLVALSLLPFAATEVGETSIPIGVAIWGVIGSLIFGSILGLNAGYKGGWWDQTIMQGLDALIAFPVIVLYLVVIAALGQGDPVVILAITVTGAPGVARLVRSLALDIKTRDYIKAAETRGESKNFIMFREILPNSRGPIMVDAMLRVGYAIFAIGTLGFLGIGLPPPDPDWGNMVNEARQFIFAYPIGVVWPAIAIASLVVGLNLFADGMREEVTRYQK